MSATIGRRRAFSLHVARQRHCRARLQWRRYRSNICHCAPWGGVHSVGYYHDTVAFRLPSFVLPCLIPTPYRALDGRCRSCPKSVQKRDDEERARKDQVSPSQDGGTTKLRRAHIFFPGPSILDLTWNAASFFLGTRRFRSSGLLPVAFLAALFTQTF